MSTYELQNGHLTVCATANTTLALPFLVGQPIHSQLVHITTMLSSCRLLSAPNLWAVAANHWLQANKVKLPKLFLWTILDGPGLNFHSKSIDIRKA